MHIENNAVLCSNDPDYDSKLLAHIESQLDLFGDEISAAEKKKAASGLLKNFAFYKVKTIKKSSPVFDYYGKVSETADLLGNGLTRRDYLQACIEHNELFVQTPETIKANVDGPVNAFEKDGLEGKHYIRACVKRPSLFSLSGEKVIANIEGMIEIFKEDGLDHRNYLAACLKQPQLFYQLPQTLSRNVNGVVDRFEKDGLDRKTYLQACLGQATLFYQSDKTIGRHIEYMMTMADMGFLPKDNSVPYPYKTLFRHLADKPAQLCFADENYIMRIDYATRNQNKASRYGLLSKPKYQIEQDYKMNFGLAFSTDSVLPEVQEQLKGRNLWPKKTKAA